MSVALTRGFPHAARRAAAAGVLAGAAILLAIVPQMGLYYVRVADDVLIYTLLALGLNMVIGYAGLLDLGFVAFYAVGAYTYALLASPLFGLHLPFLVILPIGVLLAALFGVLLGIPVLPLRGDYLAIVTLGFGEIIRLLLNNMDAVTGGPQGVMMIDAPRIAGEPLISPRSFYLLLLGLCTIVGVLVFRIERSILGKAWAAIREDQDAARGVGINTTVIKLIAFATSASIGGMAGVIFASFQRYVSPESFTFNESILVVLIIVIGGVGNILGVICGAIVLIVLPEVLRDVAQYRMLAFGTALSVLIVLRPEGLVPRGFGPAELWRLARGSREITR
jgi:branched-chain amino acid transport system permease protein